MIGLWITAFYGFCAAGKEVCYERIGCFSDKPPWSGIPGRFLPGLPDPPEGMNITFSLYTKETRNRFQILSAIYPSTIDNSHFSSHRRTRFIVHGFKSNAKNTWVIHMCMKEPGSRLTLYQQ
uniref:Triacylglycerol lipase n=1 Tax=Crocodylus porosus TaxID=8502 RepID=A0A7M4EXZ5_CROPO